MNHVWDVVSKAREEWESESGARSGPQQTTSISDTHLLVSAISAGKNLKMPVSMLELLIYVPFLPIFFTFWTFIF